MFHCPTSSTRYSRFFLMALPVFSVSQTQATPVAATHKATSQTVSSNTIAEKSANVLAPVDAIRLLFQGETLPLPPQQNAAWTAPNLSAPFEHNFVSATSKLFEQGLADPRGCEYREIEIVAESDWRGVQTVKTHGWVLPFKTSSSTRFAVGWNGLVYPLTSVGDKAGLQSDVATVLKNEQARRDYNAKIKAQGHGVLHGLYGRATGETESISFNTLLPIKACLLLRLGDAENARKLWQTSTQGLETWGEHDQDFERDAYLLLATDWIWARFDRLLQARARGDDKLALIDAQFLQTQHPLVEAEAAHRGYGLEVLMQRARMTGYSATEKSIMPGLYLSFLDDLPLYLADQQRRVKEKSPLPPSSLSSASTQKATTSQLVAMLDQVTQQDNVIGGDTTGIENALQNRGDEVVEPLLRVLESDTRLTRGVRTNMFTHGLLNEEYERTPIPTAEVALEILNHVLQINFASNYEIRDQARHPLIVTRIRAQWNKIKSLSREERWFQILADDNAPRDQWIEAAGRIVAPVPSARSSVSYGSDFVPVWAIPAYKAEGEKLEGESLRGKTQPSVTDLMLKRIETFERDRPVAPNLGATYDVEGSITNMALLLSRWDRKAALPVLQMQSATANSGSNMAQLTIGRVEAGDRKALIEYSKWFQSTILNQAGRGISGDYAPLWLYRNEPDMQELAKWLLDNPALNWRGLFNRTAQNWAQRTQNLLQSPLVSVPQIRELVLRGLADKTVIGSVAASKTNRWGMVEQNDDSKYLKLAIGEWQSWDSVSKTAPNFPAESVKRDLRVCDFYAWAIFDGRANSSGDWPAFQLYQTTGERDQAIGKVAAWVRHYTENSDITFP